MSYSFYHRIAYLRHQRLLRIIATHIRLTISLVLLTALAIILFAYLKADTLYAGGTGTREDPYQLADCTQLQNMRENLSSFYIITQDIDCQSIVQGVGWEPVGTSTPFSGSLDGQGHTITNFGLTIATTTQKGGVFGLIEGSVKNLHLDKGGINGTIHATAPGYSWSYFWEGYYAGALAGLCFGCVINNVTSNIAIHSTGNRLTGGLIGIVSGAGVIRNSFASSSIYSGGGASGGLVGLLNYGSSINNSYFSGEVTGTGYVGGLAGFINSYSSYIYNSYSTASTSLIGSGSIGGLAGSSGLIKNSFATGRVTGIGGGLIGSFSSTDAILSIANSAYDQTATGKTKCVYSPSLTSSTGTCIAINTDGLSPNYFFASTSAPLSTWDFTHTWIEHASSTPTLATSTYYTPYIGNGAGTLANPYQISSCTELQSLDTSDPYAYYVLVNDVDCTGFPFYPIGLTNGNVFSGVLDGQNYAIHNLTSLTASSTYVGIFSIINKAEIKNLGLDDISIHGYDAIGSLAGGISSSLVSKINATTTVSNTGPWGGDVAGLSYELTSSHVDGLSIVSVVSGANVGHTEYTSFVGGVFSSVYSSYISNVTASTTISGGYLGQSGGFMYSGDDSFFDNISLKTSVLNGHTGGDLGGFAGTLSASPGVTSTFNNVHVDFYISVEKDEGWYYGIGGLIGELIGAQVTNSYAEGVLTSSKPVQMVGGLIGSLSDYDWNSTLNGNVSNSFASTSIQINGNSSSVGGLIGKVGVTYPGHSLARITNSFSSGYIIATSSTNVGGLIGEDASSIISDSFSATTMITGSSTFTGGLIGKENGNTNGLLNVSYDITRTGQAQCVSATSTDGICTGVNASSSEPNFFFSNSNSPLSTWSTSIWTFLTNDFPFLTIFKPAGPTITPSSPVVTSSSTSLTFTTSIPATSLFSLGMSPTYTEGQGTTTLATSTTISLTNLLPCTTYHYTISATGSRANTSSTTDATFTTPSCVGGSTILSSTDTYADVATGTTLSLTTTNQGVSLTIPPAFSTSSAHFQIKKLDPFSITTSYPLPPNTILTGTGIYDLKAYTTSSTSLTTFANPLSVTFYYAPDDIGTHAILSYHEDTWNTLSSCTTSTSTYSITCLTSHFSLFALVEASPVTIASITPSPIIYTPSSSSFYQPSMTVSTTSPSSSTEEPIATSQSPRATSSSLFTRILRRGSIGDDVKALQIFLNNHSFTLVSSGNGSPNNETTYFGRRTENALIRFQEFYANEILIPLGLKKGTGVFGEGTRREVGRQMGR
jgi:Putative peptidoglycan binding domain